MFKQLLKRLSFFIFTATFFRFFCKATPGTALADVVLLCGAKESPLDSGSIAAKIAVLFVAEVLVLRFMLDNQELAAIARERTSKALAPKLL